MGTLTNAQFGLEAGYAFGNAKAEGKGITKRFLETLSLLEWCMICSFLKL